MPKTMNIGIIAPIPSDGTSLYRAHGPFAYISRETGAHLITSQDGDWDWTNIMPLDVLFLQRPFTAAHLMAAKTCKVLNVPLWVDYDDLYSAFPAWTQVQQSIYMGYDSLENMKACIRLADVVTVSTERLKCLSEKAQVIPNALNTYIWPLTKGKRQRILSWRGSGGHNGDLGSVMDVLREVNGVGGYSWHWFGMPHYECCEFGTVHPYRDAFSYMHEFCAVAPAIHVVPLADCAFNRAKSNNAWLEATAAGAVVVAPNWPEWQRPGIINYEGKDGFKDAILRAISMPDDKREALVDESRVHITRNLTLATVNKQRVEILKKFQP